MLSTARAIGEFGAVSVVSGKIAGETETLTLLVEKRFENFDLAGAYAASALLALIALVDAARDDPHQAARRSATHDRRRRTSPSASATSSRSTTSRSRSPDGSLTALLGPERLGKSTLLRIIAGLEAPDAGDVVIDGERRRPRVPPQKRGIGFVFQHYAAFKHMTVRDNVAFGLKIRKRPKAEVAARVDELLELVGLAGYARPLPVAALRRPAPAHGARPRAGGRAAACCCSTSRSARSTPTSAPSCARGCGGCTTRSTSRPCSSRTTRRRRWRSPTASP